MTITKLKFTLEVDEGNKELEEEICEKVHKILMETVSLLDYCANNSVTSSIIENVT